MQQEHKDPSHKKFPTWIPADIPPESRRIEFAYLKYKEKYKSTRNPVLQN
jgi:hypothetical protein